MTQRFRRSRIQLTIVCLGAVAGTAGLLLTSAQGQEGDSAGAIAREDTSTCLACHASEMEGLKAVHEDTLLRSPHKDLKCQDCHSSVTAAPHTPEMLKAKAECSLCHTDEAAAFEKSTHARKDLVPGDHPSCVFCHGSGDPHAITAGAKWSRRQKVEICSQCHRQSERMRRYGTDPDAVPSYDESFHGKALLRFGNLNVAICTDCHGHHDVLAPENPLSSTHRNNAAKTCSQAGCHPGAQTNFAMSGANHLRLKEKREPILQIEKWFFQTLTFTTILLLLGGVSLDLRRALFRKESAPATGRAVSALISLSFLFVVAALSMAAMGIQSAEWSAVAALVLLALALIFHFGRPRPRHPVSEGPKYERFSVAQRVQHGLLAISFTLLVLTGMPLRFPQIDWLRGVVTLVGGLDASRLLHRGAALVMIATWIWHTVYLVVRWRASGFSLQSMTMLPTRKDLSDFLVVTRFYLGLAPTEPKYDRFQFREKFDYFAVYWGMPIMVFSGLVLWFPITFGNLLPEIGLSVAHIAHSDEAVLAFLAIVLWHFYNTHFRPENFPMNRVFLTGTLTREEMLRDHPLELERLELATKTAGNSGSEEGVRAMEPGEDEAPPQPESENVSRPAEPTEEEI